MTAGHPPATETIMTEGNKEKKPRGPSKTALQQLEADRDRYAKQRMDALKKLNVAISAEGSARATYDAADAAFKAMDSAVNAQKMSADKQAGSPAPMKAG